MFEELTIRTGARDQMLDITTDVRAIVQSSGITSGVCYIYVPHTTAGITINENADASVTRDILYELDKMVPWNDGYRHMEGNSAAHIKASMMGFSQMVIIRNGDLQLGAWQGIYFCEFDGPRNRKVFVKIIPF
ncbi:secondary thiamine-phosphate synthase enzyme YjbQ [Thermincola potens]|uniref:Secondary thiamine-phosphate synthase enzyme n=1 Tax=Thermincola potens (strain JR) TaxID=635013 RepID=D5X889_THEPJ|nr:secondary thiamine-phosphate synthase enzyme YjbQ [Thermincola potens]ADG82809.1 protein of unknown function UPF0047 [Thermincola potens JR]